MHNSTLTAILIGTCAFVSSQVSSATNGRTQHSFECRLISGGYPYNEIAQYGYFQGGTIHKWLWKLRIRNLSTYY